jgi:hypothetical protein
MKTIHEMKLLPSVQYDIIKKYWGRIMAGDCMTYEQWTSETEEEQDGFFNWFVAQYNDTFFFRSSVIHSPLPLAYWWHRGADKQHAGQTGEKREAKYE